MRTREDELGDLARRGRVRDEIDRDVARRHDRADLGTSDRDGVVARQIEGGAEAVPEPVDQPGPVRDAAVHDSAGSPLRLRKRRRPVVPIRTLDPTNARAVAGSTESTDRFREQG